MGRQSRIGLVLCSMILLTYGFQNCSPKGQTPANLMGDGDDQQPVPFIESQPIDDPDSPPGTKQMFEGTRVDSSCLEVAWEPDIQLLGNPNIWRIKSHDDHGGCELPVGGVEPERLRLADRDPADPTKELFSLAFEIDGPVDGQAYCGTLVNYDPYLNGTVPTEKPFSSIDLMERKPKFARIEAKAFLPRESVRAFNQSNAKLPLGIWGGDPMNGADGSAHGTDCTVSLCHNHYQTGFSSRLTRTLVATRNRRSSPDYFHGPRIYSYHLNRSEVGKENSKHLNPEKGKDHPLREYSQQGEGTAMDTVYPLGQWITLKMDLTLDAWDSLTNKSFRDGRIDLYVIYEDENSEKTVDSVHMDNLHFRKSQFWHIFGPKLTELWGGPIDNSINRPRADSVTYWRDYRMLIPKIENSRLEDFKVNCMDQDFVFTGDEPPRKLVSASLNYVKAAEPIEDATSDPIWVCQNESQYGELNNFCDTSYFESWLPVK